MFKNQKWRQMSAASAGRKIVDASSQSSFIRTGKYYSIGSCLTAYFPVLEIALIVNIPTYNVNRYTV